VAGSLNREELEAIRKWPTCAVANAIELFNIRPRNQGFMLPNIECMYPDLGPMIGYAVTAVITAESPEGRRVQPHDWWKEILKIPEPRVVVIHDVDHPVMGSFWGEVNANIHKSLGCVGAVTDGSVRDMTEVKEAGFHFFASCVSVSHAYVHLVDVGVPVTVGGLPPEIAKDVPAAAQLVEDWERPIINFCKSKTFTMEGLKERYLSPRPTWPPRK
jgi:4-hydroxy-4-methyl-2-oxoglutarate aldolase